MTNTVTPITTTAPVDGRTARRDRNRELVLDAVIELFTEDQLAPNAAAVAERSGVSLRSVYRYFEDHDALVRAAIARNAERVAPLLQIPDLGEGTLEERVDRLIDRRIQLYEAAAPTARAAIVRAPGNPILGERLDRMRATLREQTEAMFEPELSTMEPTRRWEIAANADTLMQFESCEHLHVRRGHSAAETAAILRRGLLTLFSAPA